MVSPDTEKPTQLAKSTQDGNDPEQYQASRDDANLDKLAAADIDGGTLDEGDNQPVKQGSITDYFRIFTYCDRWDALLYTASCICAIASGAALPLMTIVFGQFTTQFTDYSTDAGTTTSAQQFRANVNSFVLWYIYLFAAIFVVTYISSVTAALAAVRTVRNIRMVFLEKTLRQEVGHFDRHLSIGSISAQVTTNGTRINYGIAEKLTILVRAISMFISAFTVALIIQWKLALITMSVVPPIIAASVISIRFDVIMETRIVRYLSQAAALAQEALSSVKTIHAFWAHEQIIEGYDKYLSLAHEQGKRKRPNTSLGNAVFYFSMYGGTALAFWQGFRMYASGEIEAVGTVLTVTLSVTLGSTAISSVAPQLFFIASAASAASELFAIIDKESELDPLSPSGDRPSNCDGNLEIRDLTFAYPARRSVKVLKGLNLSVPAGKTTALVGASGCGKSTLVGLLERWYQPDSGAIFLDGKNLAEYNVKWLRTKMRLVQQEPVLYRGTVFENVAKGLVDDQLTLSSEQQLELVQNACKLSNAHDFIRNLPSGYHTQVGERGSMLSGGQKQRIVIARSILSDPKILLLDEATSALDPRAENIVQDALNKAALSRTTLVIAHKLSTIQAADQIAVIADGQVVEQGTYNELLNKDAHFARLVHAQGLGETEQRSGNPNVEPVERVSEAIDTAEAENSAQKTTDTEIMKEHGLDSVNYSLIRCFYIIFREQKDISWWLLLLTIACIVGGGAFPAQAVLFARLIDVFTLVGDEARTRANFFALMYFIFAIANMLSYLVIGFAGTHVGHAIIHRYRTEIFRRMLNLDLSFFDRPENSTGALTSKLSLVPDALAELVSQNVFLILVCFVNIAGSCILAIAYGWKLGLVVVFTGMPILLGSGMARTKLEQKFERDTTERFAESAALATEAVTSIRTLASLTQEEQVCSEYRATLDRIASQAKFTISLTSLGYALSQSLEFLLMALGFWYGSRLIASGEYTINQFYVVFLAVLFGGQAAGQIFAFATSISRAKFGANYILWLRTLKATIGETDQNREKGPEGDGALVVDKVRFRYEQRETASVLDGIDLHIPSGSYVACVGPSGCGKSTLISLIERFYDPTSGSIRYGDTDIKSMSPRLYRNQISLVQQEPVLYEGSVRDNISLGFDNKPTDTEILEACRQANAHDFITSLPEGLNTLCGSKGLQFSGGQRQRIAIARAMIRKPRLLLLDEATSALDTHSEGIVQQALDNAARSRTTIAVAHRLSTIQKADIIFVFADGKVVEKGTHEQLQALRGRYYEMCLAQALDKN